MTKATARSHPNIAFIKYWGNRNNQLRLPVSSSLSMNMDGLYTETTVLWDDSISKDELKLNGEQQIDNAAQKRVSEHLDAIRHRLGEKRFAFVESSNNFPMGTGIASSAAAFAALTVAAVAANGSEVSEAELTTLARLGSGSASRSVPTGFVEWHVANTHEESYAESIANPEYWDVVDVLAIVSNKHKAVGSRQGHEIASTSDLQEARIAGAEERQQTCKQALLERDFASFAEVIELDTLLMHSVMMTGNPGLFYWQPTTLEIMYLVRQWRADGLDVCYTMDAGPNVHCITTASDAEEVRKRLAEVSGVMDIRTAKAGGPTVVTSSH